MTSPSATRRGEQLFEELRLAASDKAYVSMGGRRTTSVHEFYRYPARFSPRLARAVIELFSNPLDLVIDPFAGGGTSLVEAQLAMRNGAGADINSLATFVASAKTEMYDSSSLAIASNFADRVPALRVGSIKAASRGDSWKSAGYMRNLDRPDTWRLRNLLAAALADTEGIDDENAAKLVRCGILRTGQWALDMRETIPTVHEFRKQLEADLRAMVRVAGEHVDAVTSLWNGPNRPSLTTAALPDSAESLATRPPALVVTSPPYPGVYVNYHRWKVRGRRETPAPYWLTSSMDGHGIAHYTMSARARDGLKLYFSKLQRAYAGIASMMNPDTWLVQVVGFNDVDSQLDRYLDVMTSVGLSEVKFDELATDDDGRLWRDVPGRRWWVTASEKSSTAPATSRETVLVHRLDSVRQR